MNHPVPVVLDPVAADLPPLATLDEYSDYRAFFAPEVSAELRRLALHRLFHLPVRNVTDGLDVYQDDYTQFAPLGDLITQELRHRLELEHQRLAQAVLDPPSPTAATAAASPAASAPSRPNPTAPHRALEETNA